MTEVADIRGPARLTHGAGPVPEAPADRPAPAVEVARAPVSEPPGHAAPVSAQPVGRSGSGGFFPLLLGGAAAALIGYAVATFGLAPTGPDPDIEARLSVIDGRMNEIGDAVSGLSERIDALAQATPDAPEDFSEDITALNNEVAALRNDVSDLEASVAAIPEGGVSGPEMPDFTEAFDDRMAAFQAEIDRVTQAAEDEVAQARAEAEATRAAAERAARQVELRAALAEVSVAVDTGAPYDAALAELSDLDLPQGLSRSAESGVVPLAELQRLFPDAARAALAASTRGPAGDAGTVDRLAAFLLSQTNARSLEPREGDSADAVLSRAEAALRSGDLDTALAELEALPEGASAAMSDWRSIAEARKAATDAVAALTQDIDAM